MRWFDESLHSDSGGYGYIQRLRVDKIIYEDKSDYQHLLIFEAPHFGRVLALDGIIQITEHDEYAYHEMLAHVPILAHGDVRNTLIIGGGDGGVLREVLHHTFIDSITLVEIDEKVIKKCELYLPSVSKGAFRSSRTKVIIGDGCDFVADTNDRYDVIIVDSTDPIGPGEALFTKEFYKNCHSRLKKGGILVNQNGVPFFQGQNLAHSHKYLRGIFKDTTIYLTVVPTYVGGQMALGWSSDFKSYRSISKDILAVRYKEANLHTRYYSPDIHAASFILPPFIQDIMI